MKNRSFAGLAVRVALLAVAAPVFGHHSTAARYDEASSVTITGTIVQFRMISPHSRILVEVQGETGAAEIWDSETSSGPTLYRRGWRTDDLTPGDRVTVTGRPAVDGSTSMQLIRIVTLGGKVLE